MVNTQENLNIIQEELNDLVNRGNREERKFNHAKCLLMRLKTNIKIR